MSTSLLYHGFGIRGIVYKRTEYKAGKIILWVETPKDQMKCATCESLDVKLRGKKLRRFRSVPIGSKAVELMYPVQRLEYRECHV